jgi:alpha-tubulin suppressor-like RCC1 family protein
LGIGGHQREITKVPLPYKNIFVVSADCGDHNLVFCDTLGRVFITGYSPRSDLGYHRDGHLSKVIHHTAITDRIVKVACLYYYSIYLSENGDMWFSTNSKGPLATFNIPYTTIGTLNRMSAKNIEERTGSRIVNIGATGGGKKLFLFD